MKRTDQDRLLRELLDDETLAHARDAALEAGVRSLRRRRQRRALLTGAGASLMLALALALFVHRRAPLPAPAREIVAETPASGVKIIDDAQLLALFPDRPFALIGAPGAQRLVFLDTLRTADAAAR